MQSNDTTYSRFRVDSGSHDKTKIQALIDKQRTNLADVEYLDLDDVAKVIKDFKNPPLPEEDLEINNIMERRRSEAGAACLREAVEMSSRLGVRMNIIETEAQLPEGMDKHLDGLRDGSIKAWYDVTNDEVYVYAPNCTSKADAMVNVWHEVVAHKGLRGLLGATAYNDLCEKVYKDINATERSRLLSYSFYSLPSSQLDEMLGVPHAKSYTDLTEGQRTRFAADPRVMRRVGDEYIAKCAERGDFTNPTVWQRIKEAVLAFARHFGLANKVTDTDIRTMLSNSYNRLLIADARNIQMNKQEKALRCMHLSTPIVEASNNEELISAAKVIKDFKNPPPPDIKSIKSQNVSSDLLFRIGEKRKDQMREGMTTKLTKMLPDEIERNIAEIERLGESFKKGNGEGNPKLEKAAYHWLLTGSIRLPEDNYKILDALSVAEKKGIDPLGYSSPLALMEAHTDTKPSLRKTDPDTIAAFSDKQELPYGVTTYEVADTKEGQAAVRQVIDEHWGVDANPWCLAARIDGNLDEAWGHWQNYDAYPKRIVFKEGKLQCFSANSKRELLYWDRQDEPFEYMPVIFKERCEGGYRDVLREMYDCGTLGYPIKSWQREQGHEQYMEYYSNGKPYLEENRENGIRQGKFRMWSPDGQLWVDQSYEKGYLHGRYVRMSGGVMIEEAHYDMGEKNGMYRKWYHDGTPHEEYNTIFGDRDGVSRIWNSDGTIRFEGYWEYGEVCTEREYAASHPAELSPELREFYTLTSPHADGVMAIRSGDKVRIYQKDSQYVADLLDMKSRVECNIEPCKLAERSITFSAEEFHSDIAPRLAARGTEVTIYESRLHPPRQNEEDNVIPEAAIGNKREEKETRSIGRGR